MRAAHVGVPGGVEGVAEREGAALRVGLGVEAGAGVVDERVEAVVGGGEVRDGGFEGGVGGYVYLDGAEGRLGVGDFGLQLLDCGVAFGKGPRADYELVGFRGGV